MQKRQISNSAFTKYEDVYNELESSVNEYLRLTTEDNLTKFIKRKQSGALDNSGNYFRNRFAHIPDGSVAKAIKEAYLTGNDTEGIITTGDPEEQEIGIEQIALLTLMSNRLAKECTGQKKQQYYLKKDEAMKNLIASLYIIDKTGGEDYEEKYSYGIGEDKDGYEALYMDLPYIGQFAVHFGHKKDSIMKSAKNTAKSLLEKKQELGEISQEKLEELKEDLQTNILPEYTGYFFESVAAIPIPYNSKELNREFGRITGYQIPMEGTVNEKVIDILQKGKGEKKINLRELYTAGILKRMD